MSERLDKRLIARGKERAEEEDPFPLTPFEAARARSSRMRAGLWLAGIAAVAVERALSSFEKASRLNAPQQQHAPREATVAGTDRAEEGGWSPAAREAQQAPSGDEGERDVAAEAAPGRRRAEDDDDTTVEIIGVAEDGPLGPQIAGEFEGLEGGYGGASGGSAGLARDGLISRLSNTLQDGPASARGGGGGSGASAGRAELPEGARGLSGPGALGSGGAVTGPVPIPPGPTDPPAEALPPVTITFALFRDGGRDPVTAVTLDGGRVVKPGPQGFFIASSDALFSIVSFASGSSVGSARHPAVSLDLDRTTRSGTLELTAPHGAVEGIVVTSYDGAALSLVNWAHTVVSLTTRGPLSVVVDGASDGTVRLSGPYAVSVTLLLEGGTRPGGHDFAVETGSGNDTVIIGESLVDPVPGPYELRATKVSVATGAGTDIIVGGGSDDTVDGGPGRDVFVLQGLRSGFALVADGDGILVRDIDPSDGDQGTDRVRNVEVIRFADGREIEIDPDRPANRPPAAVADPEETVNAGFTLTVVGERLVANDIDPDGDAIWVFAVEPVTRAGGTVVEDAPGTWLYTPREGFVGTDVLRYIITDGFGGFTPATLAIAVVNTAPTPVADAPLRLPEARPALFTGAELVANDVDAEGHEIAVLSVAGVTAGGGTVVPIAPDTWLYTPRPGFSGDDVISYTIGDGYGGRSIGTLAAIVGNRAPIGADDGPLRLRPGETIQFSTGGLIANDVDEDGDPLTVTAIGQPLGGGAIEEIGGGLFTYTAPQRFVGIDGAGYVVSDGYGGNGTATVTFDVYNGNPEATPDPPLIVTAGDVGLIAFLALVVNDLDPDDDRVFVQEIAAASSAGGTVTALARDVVLYTPPADFTGVDEVPYIVADVYGGMRAGTVTILVAEPGPPAEGALPSAPGEGAPFVFTLLAGDDFRPMLVGSAEEANAIVLSDGAIGPEEAVDETGEPLATPFLLGEGGLEAFRTLLVTDLGGDNTVVAGPSSRFTLVAFTGDGNDLIEGAAGRNVVHAGGGNNRIVGGPGRDIISTGDGNDEIAGGGGDDVINAGRGDNRIWGGPGDDIIIASVGNDVIDGGDGDDDIRAGDGDNVITGGGGNDRILAGRGNDVIEGGGGDDVIDAGDGDNRVAGGAGNDRITTGSGNDVIEGGDGDDVILAGAGDDLIEAGAGNDVIDAGDGGDIVHGGEGDDTILGGAGDDALFGGEGRDRLEGGAGNDLIDGGDGDDVLAGGSGDDTIIDGAGSDVVMMDGGNDTVLNARDGARDVFVWRDRDALIETSEWDTLSVFDTDLRTGDQLDLSGLGDGLVAELIAGGEGQGGMFTVYRSEEDRRAGNHMLAIEWVEQVGNGRIIVSPSTYAKIKIGLGWSIVDVLGDPYPYS